MLTKSSRILLFIVLFLMLSLITLASWSVRYRMLAHKDALLKINTGEPQDFKVVVLDDRNEPGELDSEGCIKLHFPRTCIKSISVLGLRFDLGDYYERPMIEVIKDGEVVKRFSLNELDDLHNDDNGYHQFDLGTEISFKE